MVRRESVAAAVTVVLAFGLAGCAGGATYSAQTASGLQHAVLDLATAAHRSDLAEAQTKLARLRTMNDAAMKKGQISAPRHAAIAASITAIGADLTQLQDQAERARLQAQLEQLQRRQHGNGAGNGDEGGD